MKVTICTCTIQRVLTTAPSYLGHGTDSAESPLGPVRLTPELQDGPAFCCYSLASCRTRHKQHCILVAVMGDAAVNICVQGWPEGGASGFCTLLPDSQAFALRLSDVTSSPGSPACREQSMGPLSRHRLENPDGYDMWSLILC